MVDMREPEDMLRAASLRVTRPRTAVLEAVRAHPHADRRATVVRAGNHGRRSEPAGLQPCDAINAGAEGTGGIPRDGTFRRERGLPIPMA